MKFELKEDLDMVSTERKDSFLVKYDADGKPWRAAMVWKNALGFLAMHLIAVYGLGLAIFSTKLLTILFSLWLLVFVDIGVTVGAHRLFTHRSYKATRFLRFFLLACFTLCGQNCAYIWARDHRQHHKYSDTSADPHDSTRGFFFCHIGWLMVRKHPDVIRTGKQIDMSDLEADALVMFQKNYYKTLYVLLALAFPVLVPMYFWGETLTNAFCVSYMLRYVISLNVTWLVNSAAHLYGFHPYDKTIVPCENWFVGYISSGEGWHNYHHAFPWDYKCSELSPRFYNPNARFIEMFARWGLASDLRSVSDEGVRKRIQKKGDGSHYLWGYGDKAFDRQKEEVVTQFPKDPEEQEEEDPVVEEIPQKNSMTKRVVLKSG